MGTPTAGTLPTQLYAVAVDEQVAGITVEGWEPIVPQAALGA